jgi:hypothetical protein
MFRESSDEDSKEDKKDRDSVKMEEDYMDKLNAFKT